MSEACIKPGLFKFLLKEVKTSKLGIVAGKHKHLTIPRIHWVLLNAYVSAEGKDDVKDSFYKTAFGFYI